MSRPPALPELDNAGWPKTSRRSSRRCTLAAILKAFTEAWPDEAVLQAALAKLLQGYSYLSAYTFRCERTLAEESLAIFLECPKGRTTFASSSRMSFSPQPADDASPNTPSKRWASCIALGSFDRSTFRESGTNRSRNSSSEIRAPKYASTTLDLRLNGPGHD